MSIPFHQCNFCRLSPCVCYTPPKNLNSELPLVQDAIKKAMEFDSGVLNSFIAKQVEAWHQRGVSAIDLELVIQDQVTGGRSYSIQLKQSRFKAV